MPLYHLKGIANHLLQFHGSDVPIVQNECVLTAEVSIQRNGETGYCFNKYDVVMSSWPGHF